MYRYSVDQAIIYTSADFILFRESHFASWMERLTLENPDHGILPDVGCVAPGQPKIPESNLAQKLAGEGKDVIAIDHTADEAVRRTATLAAMRHGVDFIVNAQLAVGPLSDYASLLMRTSGYSELGNFLYIPCDTQYSNVQTSTFRLCFLADLLHILQGQLPPQMLILRANSDVVPLECEDHIYHYRAVKQRFMAAQAAFRKHRMPDPVEAAHFGRWSGCANELLKQRAMGQSLAPGAQSGSEGLEELLPAGTVRGAAAQSSVYDMDSLARIPEEHAYIAKPQSGTLAEQARMLEEDVRPQFRPDSTNDTLENLEFIGSSTQAPMIGGEIIQPPAPVVETRVFKEPPPANLRNPANVDMDVIQDIAPKLEKTPVRPFSNSLITNREN